MTLSRKLVNSHDVARQALPLHGWLLESNKLSPMVFNVFFLVEEEKMHTRAQHLWEFLPRN